MKSASVSALPVSAPPGPPTPGRNITPIPTGTNDSVRARRPSQHGQNDGPPRPGTGAGSPHHESPVTDPHKTEAPFEDNDSEVNDGALNGIVVADFSRVLAGPLCTMHLADMGAEVIKVERPDGGDDTRHWPPFLADGMSTYYAAINRNKKSVALDLSTPEDIELARRLTDRADVVIENFRPGVMAEFGLDSASVVRRNPGVIYCSITGFGSEGEGADMPGFDFLIQGMGGLMSLTGPRHGEPYRVGVAMVDVLAGLHALIGILAALNARHSNGGHGQVVEIALMQSLLAGMVNASSAALLTGQNPERAGNRHASVAPYEVYTASDGPFIIATGNDRQWTRICEVLEAPELAQDPRFTTNAGRVRHISELAESMNPHLLKRTSAEWTNALLAARVPAGPINTITEAFADAERLGLDPIWDVEGVKSPRAPITLSETPLRGLKRPPALGEDSDSVRAWLSTP
ncbi:MAG: CoA transferase [Acidimicrobiia bacterium]|nr:CoA transferase [Acidimicrobiia bacterium]